MPEERKLVTILFADVTGSTSLGESLDPEDFRALMGRYYEHARQIIADYGGTLEKFIGDAVMAVFGLPVAHEDDAERALAASLALRQVISQDAFLGESFQLRMGVNTGEVMATTDASRSDFLVTGDAVNTAARLQQNANPGEIIASERTAEAARRAFVFGEPREIQVKGKQLPLRIFPLIEKRALRLVERPPLIGRKQDLLQLEILCERVLEEERPQLASIIAPAGTGKTRLLEEFLEQLDAADGLQVATARCQPYGETMAYLPLQGLLQELLGGEVSKEQVAACFTKGGYRADDAARLAGHVLATLGREGESGVSVDRQLIFSAWRLLIEVLAQQAPRIIVFENLHWASESLLDLVEHITSLYMSVPLLLLALSRPELLDRRPNWGGGRQNFTSLALQPLSAKRSRELVKRLSPDLSEMVSAKIAESCGGNPFFAQELVRGLAERGLADAAATTDALPDTVYAAVLARLDLLSKTEREVLQVASVASRSFTPALFQHVLPAWSAEEIEAALNGLLARDMLAPEAGGVFTFHHGLMLDVTYGTLSRAERIRLHKAIAASILEEANDQLDECVGLLAYHYYKAVELSRLSAVPQQLAVETERAIKFQVRAGELACNAGAFGESLAYFERAIQLAGDEQKVALYEQLGDSLPRQLRIQVRGAYQHALDLWRALPEHLLLTGARLARKLLITNVRLYFADPLPQEEAEALWQEGMQLAEQAGDEQELWRIRAASIFLTEDLRALSVDEMRQNEKAQRLQQLAVEAADFMEQHQDWEALSEILDGYSGLQLRCGENSAAMATIQRRLQLPGLSFNERVDVISSFVAVAFLSGDYDASIRMMHEALDSLRPGEPLEVYANTLNAPVFALYLTGRWSEVTRFRERCDEIWNRIQDIEGAGQWLLGSYQGFMMMVLSREDEADATVIEQILRQINPKWRDVAVLPFAAIYRDGDFSQFEIGTRGLDLVGVVVMFFCEHEHQPPEEVLKQGDYYADDLTLRATAIARALMADDNQALARAIDEAEEHHLIVHAAHMRIILAKRTGDRSQLERARAVLEPLEDRLFLKKLREVEALLSAE